MDRAIKFKVWDKILQGWSKNTMGWYYSENGVVSPESGNRYVFVQFTGLYDKNGKEIYEGDIVKWHALICKIKYVGHSFWLWCTGIYNEYTRGNGREFNSLTDEIEVIGNIYENPIE